MDNIYNQINGVCNKYLGNLLDQWVIYRKLETQEHFIFNFKFTMRCSIDIIVFLYILVDVFKF